MYITIDCFSFIKFLLKGIHIFTMSHSLEQQLITIIKNDEWMINVLKIVSDLKLPDCWIGAGFIRNKVWDVLHHKERTLLNDIDVIYFDENTFFKEDDMHIENKLKKAHPNLHWSVKNQARMHLRNGHKPYINCNHAISFWPETATSIAIRLNSKNHIEYIAPYGLDDLFNLLVIPTPEFDLKIYTDRINKKGWKETWSELEIKIPNHM